MIILLVYVGLIMPYNVCFIPSEPGILTATDILDLFIDLFFGIDIIVNFISAYDDPVKDVTIIDFKTISKQYILSWFMLDVIAIIPFSLFEQANNQGVTSNGGKLSRLARLPRLYRLVRILRMIKMLRIVKKQDELNKFVEKLNISVGFARLLKTLAI